MSEEKPFRVMLDLSELNLNVSKYVWMNVSPRELNNIADFKNVISKKINFDRKNIKLFVHDGLLPEDEKIIVLRENDTVKIQYEDPSIAVNCNSNIFEYRTSRVSNPGGSSGDYDDEMLERSTSQKRKRKSDVETSDIVDESNHSNPKSHKKKKKHKRSLSNSITEEDTSTLSTREEITPESLTNEIEMGITHIKSPEFQRNEEIIENGNESNLSNNFELFEVAGDSAVVQGNCKKRKRKRSKKRKNMQDASDYSISDNANSLSTEQVKNTTSTSFCDKFSSIRKHIRFTSPTRNCDVNSGKNLEVTDLNSSSSNCDFKNSLEASGNTYKTPYCPINRTVISHKNSTPASQTFLKQNSWSVSPMQKECFSKTEQTSVAENKGTPQFKKEGKLPYADYPILDCLPLVGTHLAYKILELDENYSPSVSTYKEGIIQKIDPTTEEMEIQLLEVELKPGRVGKFEILSEDEVPPTQVIESVNVSWSSLIEPRLIAD